MSLFKSKQRHDQQPQESKLMSVIDIEPLLAEILPEALSDGNDQKIDSALVVLERKVESISSSDEDDESGRKGEWREIKQSALELSKRTHDLRVAMLLTRALLHRDGIIGFHDGLKLLQGLIERYWDTLHPQIDAEDKNDPFFTRVNILEELCDWQIMIKPLMKATMCASRAVGRFNLRDIRIASGIKIDELVLTDEEKKSPVGLETIKAAFKDCEIEDLLAKKEAIGISLQRINSIETGLMKKVGSARAPDFSRLTVILTEMDDFFEKQLAGRVSSTSSALKQKQKPEKNKNTVSSPQLVEPSAGQPDKPMEMINNRQDVIRMLDQICTYYEQNEPASPVPLLLRRARRLVEKDFFEIMQDLAPKSAAEIKTLIGEANDDGS
jgi:type VI secretion system protein ImpA